MVQDTPVFVGNPFWSTGGSRGVDHIGHIAFVDIAGWSSLRLLRDDVPVAVRTDNAMAQLLRNTLQESRLRKYRHRSSVLKHQCEPLLRVVRIKWNISASAFQHR